jgi:hypothetical protein
MSAKPRRGNPPYASDQEMPALVPNRPIRPKQGFNADGIAEPQAGQVDHDPPVPLEVQSLGRFAHAGGSGISSSPEIKMRLASSSGAAEPTASQRRQ